MRKFVVATIAALSFVGSGILVPATGSAQKMTYAELYQSLPKGAFEAGPEPTTGSVISVNGQDFVESITEVQIGESPYPGITIELIPQRPSYPHQEFTITASGGRIYPRSFGIPFSLRIDYIDGSFEYYADEFSVYPLDSLVAENPAVPVVTDPPPWISTVTETVTVTVTAPPVTTTVTAEPTEITVTAPPETTTVTAPPVTTTVTPEPVETTITAPPVTTTVTAPAETTTVTAPPEPSDSSSVGGNSGGMIAFIIGILAALGIGAGGAFAAIQNGLI